MLKCVLAAVSLLALTTQAHAQSAADKAALEMLPSKFSQAWATHDGSKLAELVADNIDWITVGGTWYRGKRDFQLYHTRLLTGRFREAQWTALEHKVDFIRPDLAFVRWSWRMDGDKNFDGTLRPPRVGILTTVVEKQANDWKVIAAHNTNGIPAPPEPLPEEVGIRFPITLPNPEPIKPNGS